MKDPHSSLLSSLQAPWLTPSWKEVASGTELNPGLHLVVIQQSLLIARPAVPRLHTGMGQRQTFSASWASNVKGPNPVSCVSGRQLEDYWARQPILFLAGNGAWCMLLPELNKPGAEANPALPREGCWHLKVLNSWGDYTEAHVPTLTGEESMRSLSLTSLK